jgi:hypothetical protein
MPHPAPGDPGPHRNPRPPPLAIAWLYGSCQTLSTHGRPTVTPHRLRGGRRLVLDPQELQDVAHHVQSAPSQLLALRPIDNDVPDTHRGRAPHLPRTGEGACCAHSAFVIPPPPSPRRTGFPSCQPNPWKASSRGGTLPHHTRGFCSRRVRPRRERHQPGPPLYRHHGANAQFRAPRTTSHVLRLPPRTRTCDQGTPRAARRLPPPAATSRTAPPPPGPTFRCYVTTAAPPPPGRPVTGPPGTESAAGHAPSS